MTIFAHWAMVFGVGAGVATAVVFGPQKGPGPPLVWKRQASPWNPPAGVLPDSYVQGARKLLAAGFGDPRGGQYRVIYPGIEIYQDEFPPHYPFKPQLVLKETRGWYFPARDGAPARAVLTDGVTCSPAKVGPPADLDADIGTSLSDKHGATWMERFDPNELKSSEGLLLLCLLGRFEDAKHLASSVAPVLRPKNGPFDIEDTETAFSQEVGFYCFNTYTQGDDELAYQMATLQKSVADHYKSGSEANLASGMPGTAGLSPLDELIENLERRPQHPRSAPAPKESAVVPQSERIKREIDSLQDISIQVEGFHGLQDEDFAETPQVQALIHEGPPAVSPILDSIENDNRFTRSYDFDSWCPVREAAYAAFRGISGFDTIVPSAEPLVFEGPHWHASRFVADLRTFWSSYGSLQPSERYYRILADDHATPKMWLEAAVRLIQPEDVNETTDIDRPEFTDFEHPDPMRSFHLANSHSQKNLAVPVSSAAVRFERCSPSLNALLQRRIATCLAESDSGEHAQEIAEEALQLARYLEVVDPEASVRALQRAGERYHALIKKLSQTPFWGCPSQEAIWNFELRGKLGDSAAWRDYVAMLDPLSPNQVSENYDDWLRPLASARKSTYVDQVLEKLFNDPASKWNLSNDSLQNVVMSHLVSPLLSIPAYQESVMRLLDDRDGVDKISNDGNYLITSSGSGSAGDQSDPLMPKIGQTRSIRACDKVAESLAFALKGAPPFQEYWPVANKDAAIRLLKEFLRKHSKDMTAVLPIFNSNGWGRRR